MDDVKTAVDQPPGKADLVIVDAIPQLDPQWIDTMTASPRCRTACTRAMRSSAAASERPGSKSTPGRVAVAAQPGGIPLEAVPHAKITARPPVGAGTAAGRRARPCRARLLPPATRRRPGSGGFPLGLHGRNRARGCWSARTRPGPRHAHSGQVIRAHPVVHRLAGRVLSAPGVAGFQVDHPGIGRYTVEYVQRIPPGPGEIGRPRDRPVGSFGQAEVGSRVTGVASRNSGSPGCGSTWSTPRPSITSPQRNRVISPSATMGQGAVPVVQLAVKATGDVRRRVVRARYGRRGRSGDPEYGIKNLLVRNLEHLSRPSSPRSSTPWTATGTRRRSPRPGSPRKSSATR